MPTVIEAVLLIGRGGQFASAMLLFGAPLFGLYGFGGEGGGFRLVRSLVMPALGLSAVAAVLMLAGQAAAMTGEPGAALSPPAWLDVLSGTQFGKAWLLRVGLLMAMTLAVFRRSSRWTCLPMAVVGGFLAASLAWMGHGGAGEGTSGLIRLLADMVHLLAACAWLGALGPLVALVVWARRSGQEGIVALASRALERFSGFGLGIVALLIASGVANGAFLLGRTLPASLITSAYGRVLVAKLVAFVGMLALAGFHRWRATPALARSLESGTPRAALQRLELSLTLETVLALAVLALVAWLGVMEPPIDAA